MRLMLMEGVGMTLLSQFQDKHHVVDCVLHLYYQLQ